MIPSLAQGLRDALAAEAAARERVITFIEHLFPTWRRLFPEFRCWQWLPPDEVDVWGLPSTEHDLVTAAIAFHLAGFAAVRLHSHGIERAATCRCPTRSAT